LFVNVQSALQDEVRYSDGRCQKTTEAHTDLFQSTFAVLTVAVTVCRQMRLCSAHLPGIRESSWAPCLVAHLSSSLSLGQATRASGAWRSGCVPHQL